MVRLGEHRSGHPTDNGVGLSGPVPAGQLAGKFGLRMARERAAYLGGTLTLAAGAERGVTLTMILPKPAAAG